MAADPIPRGFNTISCYLVVPDPGKSLRDGAIAPWNSPAYAHELEELVDLADQRMYLAKQRGGHCTVGCEPAAD